jgi:ABC-type transport system involved in multi-copper enzyme maturation permease subunit
MIGLRLFVRFLAAEALKLRRATITRAVLIAMCAAPLVATSIVAALGSTAAVFPNVVVVTGMSFWLLSGLAGMLLTAGTVGSEFELGTANTCISRGLPRWQFVAGKALVLSVFLAAATLSGWVCGSIGAVVSHLAHIGSAGLGKGIAILLSSGLLAVAISVLTAVAYVGLVMAIGVTTRSSALAMFGGLGLYIADFTFGEFTPFIGLQDKGLGGLSLLSNTNMLLNQLPFPMGADWTASAGQHQDPLSVVLVMVCYALGGVVAASVVLERLDLRGKS